jgi:integrase
MGVYKRDEIWWIGYMDANGKWIRESTNSTRKTDAQTILEKKKTESKEGKYPILRKTKKIKFDVFATEYLKECEEKKSYAFYKQMIGRLSKFFGGYSLDQITFPLVKEYKRKRRNDEALNRNKKVSPATVNRELAILRNALNIAVENGHLTYNPIAMRKNLFAKETERQYIFSIDEINALIAEASQPLKYFILLGVNTGMREGEVMGLRWNEIDLNRKIITLTAIRTKSSKTRTIYMNDVVFDLLSKQKLTRQGSEYVFPNLATEKPYKPAKPYKWISHSWKLLLAKCNINPPKDIARPRFQDLRHTYGTKEGEAGTPQVTIRDILGHKYSTTTDRYMRGTEKSKREAADLVQFGSPAGEIVELPKIKAK